MHLMKKIRLTAVRIQFVVVSVTICALGVCAAESAPDKVPVKYTQEKNIFYPDVPEATADELQKARCRLDIEYPQGLKNCPVAIWFHGGGLSGGDKYIPNQLKNRKYVLIGATYRFSPAVKCPVYIEDAAAAVAWVFRNCEKYGGDPTKIYISGHSAGGYLTAMLGLDPRWLGKHGIKPSQLAGIAPMSGMMSTHFQIRAERGDKAKHPVVDEFAPIWHANADTPPVLLITGDREIDWPGRVEENLLLARSLKVAGNKEVTMYELQGYGHSMEHPGLPLFQRWIDKRQAALAASEVPAAQPAQTVK